jgi:hypothetical protein
MGLFIVGRIVFGRRIGRSSCVFYNFLRFDLGNLFPGRFV